jgi:hypothetical protein
VFSAFGPLLRSRLPLVFTTGLPVLLHKASEVLTLQEDGDAQRAGSIQMVKVPYRGETPGYRCDRASIWEAGPC